MEAGARVIIIGAGGIGFDVAEYLTAPAIDPVRRIEAFYAEWGVDPDHGSQGGLATPVEPVGAHQHGVAIEGRGDEDAETVLGERPDHREQDAGLVEAELAGELDQRWFRET